MSALVEAKRAWYREERVARGYDAQRFGGASGEYVNAREIDLTLELLPAYSPVVADVGCGTGRLLPSLRSRAASVIGLDASLAMLSEAAAKCHPERSEGPRSLPMRARSFGAAAPRDDRAGPSLVAADAFALPLGGASCDALTCMRVLFHFADVRPLLRELRRIAKPGAILVCDTSAWSPRGLLPLGRARWGERVSALSEARFQAIARAEGWQLKQVRRAFLISPYMYRRLPWPLPRALEGLEPLLPHQLQCRLFWALTAA
ncbi:MAG TPA: class I SAM-dependent methyltransferase [Chloroflexota bacterium]|nr:class I SAM-dependent methyltransferase [Chloroflexota bacterium]